MCWCVPDLELAVAFKYSQIFSTSFKSSASSTTKVGKTSDNLSNAI